jgi:hypothetical protein
LQQAHVGEYTPLVNVVGLALEQSLDLYLEASVESTAHLLPLNELTSLFGTTVDYLGQLARSGKFEAKKRGQYWYASKEAVQQYFQEANVQPRGRPRHKTSTDSHPTPGDPQGSIHFKEAALSRCHPECNEGSGSSHTDPSLHSG